MFNNFDFAPRAYTTHITRISNLKLRFNFLKFTVLQKVRTFHFFFTRLSHFLFDIFIFKHISHNNFVFSESTE